MSFAGDESALQSLRILIKDNVFVYVFSIRRHKQQETMAIVLHL